MELFSQSVWGLRELLQRGKLSSEELVNALIARTEAAGSLNVYTDFDAQALRQQARQADQLRASGQSSGQALPLLGIPIGLKDNVDAHGFTSSAGTGALRGKRPAQDAALVRRLRAAGALLSGKLNMHELAFGITNNNAVTGAVRNPWDQTRIPGGSSGGSGAAVAAGLVPAAIGTDTGGSVRVPAALCGVAGFRPSVGRISADGVAPISATRDTPGPLARTIIDCALIDEVLTGEVLTAENAPLDRISLKGVRLGIPRNGFWDDLEPGVAQVSEACLDALRTAGTELIEIAQPGIQEANQDVGFPIALYEFVRDMRRYLIEKRDGISMQALMAGIGSPDVAAVVKPLLGEGAIPQAIYATALVARRRLQSVYVELFARSRIEALVFPTTPLTACKIGEDETVSLNGRDCPTFLTYIRNTDPGSNAGIPGVSLSAGLSGGLPVGLALDGLVGQDRRLLAIAAAIEAVLPPAPTLPPTPSLPF